MLARRDYDLGQQQCPRRPTARQKFMPLGDCIVFAVTGWWPDQPFLIRRAADANLRSNFSIDGPIDDVELPRAFQRQREFATAKINPMNLAIVRVAQAETRMPDWRERRSSAKKE